MRDPELNFIPVLEQVIRNRLDSATTDSYTATLAAAGVRRVAQKVGEEAIELALAAVAGDRNETVAEAADLVYHVLVLLNERGLSLADVEAELERRHRDRA